jgi:hypothetical protein
MSQQQFFSGESDERSYKSRNRQEVKEEHPGSFEESLPPYDYQERVTYKYAEAEPYSSSTRQNSRQQYQTGRTKQTRTRKSGKIGKYVLGWAIVIGLLVLIIKVIIPLLAIVFAIAFLLVLIPLAIILALVIAIAVGIWGFRKGWRLQRQR